MPRSTTSFCDASIPIPIGGPPQRSRLRRRCPVVIRSPRCWLPARRRHRNWWPRPAKGQVSAVLLRGRCSGRLLQVCCAVLALGLHDSPFDRIRPEYSRDVLTQKARDAIARLGYESRARDAAVGFEWNDLLLQSIAKTDGPSTQWDTVLKQRPSPLAFWYRQSAEPLVATTFHNDLLTPGIVDRADPPPISSDMIQVNVDHQGRLTFFEAIPPQRQSSPVHAAPVDWTPLFQLAGLDQSTLQPVDPVWTFLAASDTRAAWTGKWPESGRPLRVEAAAFGGRPVAFMLIGDWQKPWRMADETSSDHHGVCRAPARRHGRDSHRCGDPGPSEYPRRPRRPSRCGAAGRVHERRLMACGCARSMSPPRSGCFRCFSWPSARRCSTACCCGPCISPSSPLSDATGRESSCRGPTY